MPFQKCNFNFLNISQLISKRQNIKQNLIDDLKIFSDFSYSRFLQIKQLFNNLTQGSQINNQHLNFFKFMHRDYTIILFVFQAYQVFKKVLLLTRFYFSNNINLNFYQALSNKNIFVQKTVDSSHQIHQTININLIKQIINSQIGLVNHPIALIYQLFINYQANSINKSKIKIQIAFFSVYLSICLTILAVFLSHSLSINQHINSFNLSSIITSQ
ncbi:hypothetical protein ABPG72_015541 [Tetrahymena utriculariae]